MRFSDILGTSKLVSDGKDAIEMLEYKFNDLLDEHRERLEIEIDDFDKWLRAEEEAAQQLAVADLCSYTDNLIASTDFQNWCLVPAWSLKW